MDQLLTGTASLGNPKRQWRQRSIPITSFQCFPSMEAIDDVARLCKEAGFTALEFLKRLPPEALAACVAACEKYGLGFILEDWRYFGAFQDSRMAPWSPESLAEAVETYAKSPACMGYYVWDEPYPGQFPLACEVVDTLERLDPAHLPYTVALPSYQDRYTWPNGRYEEYLKAYFDIIQPPVISLDYYPFFFEAHNPGELDRGNLYNDIGLLRRIGLEHDTPIWFYFQCWRHSAGDPPLSAEMVRYQFYNVLLHGGKGMQWFIIFDYIVTHRGTKGYMFETARRLNAEVKALENTLLALTSAHVYHGAALPRPYRDDDPVEPVNCRFADDIADDPLLVSLPVGVSAGTFTDGHGNDYALILNRDFEAEAAFTLPLRGARRVLEVSRTDGVHRPLAVTAALPLTLAPGDGILLRLDPPDSDVGTITYQIEA